MRETDSQVRGTAVVEEPLPQERPVKEIFRDMVAHVNEIVRTQLKLLSLKIRQDVALRRKAAIAIVVANVLILYGGAFVLLGIIYALSTVWPPWLAAVSVGAAVGIFGSVILTIGLKRVKSPKAT